jgi:hypothetical protein
VGTRTNRSVTSFGVLPTKANREKLNYERDAKSLPVNMQRDGAESGKACQVGRGEASVFCPPK